MFELSRPVMAGIRLLIVLGASLVGAAPVDAAGSTQACLTGTAPVVANDLAQVNAARQAVQAACPGPVYAGMSRNGRGAYKKCVTAAAMGEFLAGRLRAECLATVRDDETDSVFLYKRDANPEACLTRALAGKKAGQVTCKIVPTTTATGKPITRCKSSSSVASQVCFGSSRCIDAGDSNLNGYLDAGDTGQCGLDPMACRAEEDCAAVGACPADAPQGCTCSLTAQGKRCVPRCTSEAGCCSVAGGTVSAPTNLASIVNAPGPCTVFVLADGYYAPTTVTRSGITIRAASTCSPQLASELQIQAADVTIDGVSITALGVAMSISEPGAHVTNSCIQGFGKTRYGNGIWIYQEALDPTNRIIIENNRLDDWGGSQFSGGIAIGKADDDLSVPAEISVEIRNNRITRGPTKGGIYNAAIQSFHPFLAYKNFIDTVSGTAFQNKTFNSRVACNEVVHNVGDGALYNRLASNNVWEYNVVHDSEVGIDHFMGDGTVFRGNVIYDVQHLGRVKDQEIGSTNVTFENNTFYGSTGWAGFIWDATSGGTISNVVWRRNVFHTIGGISIHTDAQLDPLWDEYENVFFAASPPTGTTGATSGSSVTLDPDLAAPPADFTVQAPAAAGKGAPWPPCP